MKRHILLHLLLVLVSGSGLEMNEMNDTESAWTGLSQEDEIRLHLSIDRLHDNLAKDYNKEVRPNFHIGQPVTVNISMTVSHFDLDELESTLHIQCWLYKRWQDDRLKWNPVDYQGLKVIRFPEESVWKPDINIYNITEEITTKKGNADEEDVLVFADGTVMWAPTVYYKVLCQLNLRYWPYDQQICNFGLTSDMNVHLAFFNNSKGIALNGLTVKNLRWSVTETRGAIEKVLESHWGREFTWLEPFFTFYLKRNSPSFLPIVIVPALMLMVLTLGTFLLPPNSPERMWTGLINVLVICLYLLHFESLLPSLSDHTPFIVSFFSDMLILVTGSLLLNTVMLRWLRLPRIISPPFSVRNYSGRIIGRVLYLGELIDQIEANYPKLSGMVGTEMPSGVDSDTHPVLPLDAGSSPTPVDAAKSPKYSQFDLEWLILAAAIDRLSLVVYGVVFVALLVSYVA